MLHNRPTDARDERHGGDSLAASAQSLDPRNSYHQSAKQGSERPRRRGTYPDRRKTAFEQCSGGEDKRGIRSHLKPLRANQMSVA